MTRDDRGADWIDFQLVCRLRDAATELNAIAERAHDAFCHEGERLEFATVKST